MFSVMSINCPKFGGLLYVANHFHIFAVFLQRLTVVCVKPFISDFKKWLK